jgi:hypothetical protein
MLRAGETVEFTHLDAIDRLTAGDYRGMVSETPHPLGSNGAGKTWYYVTVTDGPAHVGDTIHLTRPNQS